MQGLCKKNVRGRSESAAGKIAKGRLLLLAQQTPAHTEQATDHHCHADLQRQILAEEAVGPHNQNHRSDPKHFLTTSLAASLATPIVVQGCRESQQAKSPICLLSGVGSISTRVLARGPCGGNLERVASGLTTGRIIALHISFKINYL